MIKVNRERITGFEEAIEGCRKAYNSQDRSDSTFGEIGNPEVIAIGNADLKLLNTLAKAGTDHAKYRRVITVYADITAPLYWWKEFDTYKVGTTALSTSTMHTLADEAFSLSDFSHDQLPSPDEVVIPLVKVNGEVTLITPRGFLALTVKALNEFRDLYLKTKDRKYWWCMIQLLPSSFNQTRMLCMNYEVLSNIYQARQNHKLDEWVKFCKWIETLPYAKEIICV